MRKFLIFLIIVFIIVVWFFNFCKSGKLQTYLDDHPHPTWGPRIQYYIANFYLFRSDYQTCLEAADRVYTVYPKSVYAENAMYLSTRCLENLGKRSEAMTLLEKFREEYPDSDKSKVAEKRYRKMRGY